MQLSARYQLRGTITAITRGSAEGLPVVAVIKSTEVMIGTQE